MIRSLFLAATDAAVALARRRATSLSAATMLTSRQREVLGALAHGRQTKEIARDLGIKESTVKTHIAKACHRLGATTRAQAVARYVQLTKR
ncbi:MAG: response regulator transcription factor [Chloroflexi bacterium]|nr:MAG: response regulator transcription factor [Chloroflexota bacterium]